MRTHSGGNRLRQVGRQIVERSADSAPEPAWSKPPDRLIDGNDAADLQRLRGFLFRAVLPGVDGISQDLKLRLNDLQFAAALIFFDFAVQRDHLTGRELVLQISRIEPEATQARSPLPDGELENRLAPRAE